MQKCLLPDVCSSNYKNETKDARSMCSDPFLAKGLILKPTYLTTVTGAFLPLPHNYRPHNQDIVLLPRLEAS